jgi:hypothetical protein
MPADFTDEAPTMEIPYESLSEVAAKWRAQVALEEKQLRQVCSNEQTQRMERLV